MIQKLRQRAGARGGRARQARVPRPRLGSLRADRPEPSDASRAAREPLRVVLGALRLERVDAQRKREHDERERRHLEDEAGAGRLLDAKRLVRARVAAVGPRRERRRERAHVAPDDALPLVPARRAGQQLAARAREARRDSAERRGLAREKGQLELALGRLVDVGAHADGHARVARRRLERVDEAVADRGARRDAKGAELRAVDVLGAVLVKL